MAILLRMLIGVLLLSCTPFASAIRNAAGNYRSAAPEQHLASSGASYNDQVIAGKTPGHDSNLAFSTSSTLCNFQEDLTYTQDTSSYLPSGMPIFHVTFYNTCADCPFANIRIQCGDFASATLVDPTLFKKVGYNDCILNNGGPLAPEGSIAFEYSSTFAFPMNVATAHPAC